MEAAGVVKIASSLKTQVYCTEKYLRIILFLNVVVVGADGGVVEVGSSKQGQIQFGKSWPKDFYEGHHLVTGEWKIFCMRNRTSFTDTDS